MKQHNQTLNDTVKSIRQNYPQARVVLQNKEMYLVQKEPDKKDFFVVPLQTEKSYTSFTRRSYTFLKFMRSLGCLCNQLNQNIKDLSMNGTFIARADCRDNSVTGYAARLYYQEKEDKSKTPFEMFVSAVQKGYENQY